jgi:prolyl-tRNA synthetase
LTLVEELKQAGIKVKYDDSENARPGWKFAEYELKGVPLRIGIGARDIAITWLKLHDAIQKKREVTIWRGWWSV